MLVSRRAWKHWWPTRIRPNFWRPRGNRPHYVCMDGRHLRVYQASISLLNNKQADNLSGMLSFDEDAINTLIEQHRRALNSNGIPNGWGCGPIVSNFSGLQGSFFRVLGKQDRTPGEYRKDAGDGGSGETNEYFHPTIRIRKTKVESWSPNPMRGWAITEPDGEAGWKWVKNGVQEIPEYVLRTNGMSLAYNDRGVVRHKVSKSLSRLLCPKDVLADLDRDSTAST